MEEKLSSYGFSPPDFSAPERNPRGPLIFALIFVLILVGGFTGILASRVWDPLWNPFRPDPEKVILRAIKEMEKVKTFHQKFEGKVSFFVPKSERTSSEAKIDFKFSGNSKQDLNQLEKPKTDSTFDLEVIASGEKEIGVKFALGGEVRTLDEQVYIKFTKLPTFDFLEMINVDFSSLEGFWIKIDQESIINLQKKLDEEFTPEKEKFYKEKTEKEERIQKELQEKIKEKLIGRKWFVVKKELPDEKIDEVSVYHYVVSLNNEEIVNLISEIWKEIERVMLEESGMAPTIEEEKLKKGLKELFEKIGEIGGEIWIGKKDYLLYKFSMEKKIDLRKFAQEEEEVEGTILISARLENSKFNQPVKIEAPSEYKPVDEVLAPLFEMFLGTAKRQFEPSSIMEKEWKTEFSLSRLQFIAEFLYDEESSYKNLCKNYQLNKTHAKYGKDLSEIESAIKEAQGGKLSLSCYSADNSYCVIVDLPTPKNKKYCVDNFSGVVEISGNLTCTGKGTSKEPYRCPEQKIEPKLPKFPFERDLFPASILEGFSRMFKR